MSYIIAVSVLALSLKLVTLIGKWGLFLKAPKSLMGFCLSMFGMNVIELTSFHDTAHPSLLVLQAYYIFVGSAAYSALYYVVESSFPRLIRYWPFFAIAAAAFFAATLIPDFAIIGAQSIGYTITRIPGPHYWLIQALLLTPILGIIITLSARAYFPRPAYATRVTRIQILAFFPLAIVGVLVIALMAHGMKINGAVVISLTVCITIWLLIFASSTSASFRLLSMIPNTPEHKSTNALFDYLAEPGAGFREAVDQLERMLLHEALELAHHNKSKAAELLKLPRATFVRMLNKHDI